MDTEFVIRSIIISNGAESAYAVLTEVEDEHIHIVHFNLRTKEKTHIKEIKGEYVKADEIIQNENERGQSKETRYCLPYFQDGRFKLYIFNEKL